MNDTVKGAIFGLGAAAIWGSLYVVADIVLDTIPPFTLLLTRLVIGIAILGAVAYRTSGGLLGSGATRRQIVQVLAIGFIGFGISIGLQFVGTEKSTAVNGTLITSAAPAFILIFAAFILREKLTLQRIAAVVLATIGVIVIIDPAKADFGSQTFMGDVALAGAAITWGLYSVLVRKVSARLDTLHVTLLALIGGLFLTVPATAVELSQRPIGPLTPGIILGALYLSTVAMAGAMWMWNRAFALVDASVASLFFFAQPFVGTILSVLILNQQITANLAIGSALIIGGVVLSLIQFQARGAKSKLPASETS